MTDERGWGTLTCPAVDPTGAPCVLEGGHEGNHLTRAQAPRAADSYIAQLVAIAVLVLIVTQVLPIGNFGPVERLLIAALVVGLVLMVIRRRG